MQDVLDLCGKEIGKCSDAIRKGLGQRMQEKENIEYRTWNYEC
jgi:hypothetical protein